MKGENKGDDENSWIGADPAQLWWLGNFNNTVIQHKNVCPGGFFAYKSSLEAINANLATLLLIFTILFRSLFTRKYSWSN